jgi:hypothetical protein
VDDHTSPCHLDVFHVPEVETSENHGARRDIDEITAPGIDVLVVHSRSIVSDLGLARLRRIALRCIRKNEQHFGVATIGLQGE